MFFQIIEILWFTVSNLFVAFMNATLEIVNGLSLFQDVSNAFSWPNIICVILGLPICLSVIIKIILFIIKHSKKSNLID